MDSSSFVLVAAASSTCCHPLLAVACRDGDAALVLKLVAFAFLQLAWATGMWVGCVQLLTQAAASDLLLSGLHNLVTSSFASGFTLAVALAYLQSDRVLWSRFPYCGFAATLLALLVLLIDTWVRQWVQAQSPSLFVDMEKGSGTVSGNDEKASSNSDPVDDYSLVSLDCIKQESPFTAAYSTVLGVFLGLSQTHCIMGPMVAALTLRQFFKGVSAATCAASLKQVHSGRLYKLQLAAQLLWSFLSSPCGLAVGIGISSIGFSSGLLDDRRAVVMETLLQRAAALFLTFESCKLLLHTHNCLRERTQCHSKSIIRVLYYGAILLGAGIMPLIASKAHEAVCNWRGQDALYLYFLKN